MSFKNFSLNISNTISELKNKNYSFSAYKKFSLSYLLILILALSFLLPNGNNKIITNKTNTSKPAQKVIVKKTLQDKAIDTLKLARKCKNLVPKHYQSATNSAYYNNVEFADNLKKFSIKGPNDSGWNTISDRTYNIINIMRNAGADC